MKGINMKVYFYQAECGDAARICYCSDNGKLHNLFIDSGFDRTFRHVLANEIETLVENGHIINGWVISHIHDDHIGGVVRYLDTIESGEFNDIVKHWYYNPPRQYVINEGQGNKVSEIKSIDQGDKLYEYLAKNMKLPVQDIVAGLVLPFDGGLEITVLSPSSIKLNRLRKKYSQPGLPLEQNEDESVSVALAPKVYDYHLLIEAFDLKKKTQDSSIENGSSISMITTLNDKNILWLADSHPSDIVKSLKAMNYTPKNKLKCNWVKVAHHGSKGNNSDALYSLIDSENYLISANGDNNHCLPTKEAIVRIIKNKHRLEGLKYHFYFTYDNTLLRSMFENEDPKIFSTYNFELIFLSDGRFFEFDV